MAVIKFFSFLSIVLYSFAVLADGKVILIKNSNELEADLDPHPKFLVDKRVMIISKKDDKVVGFGLIKDINLSVAPHPSVIEIEEIIDNSLIAVGDVVYPFSYDLIKYKKVPGFTSLTLTGNEKIPAQYKELAYLGVFTSEGHTLDKDEILISPFQLQYGVTNSFGIKHVNTLLLDGYLNLGAKVRVVRNQFAKISTSTLVAYKTNKQDWIWQAGAILTMPRNAKFQNHFTVNLTLDPQFKDADATEGLNLFQTSDIRNITEYITDSWNRVLFGVLYDVKLQSFGGTFSYMWIWDTFHMSLGMATRDFTELKIGDEGYYYVYDLFWRF